jgi:hypothetical protein
MPNNADKATPQNQTPISDLTTNGVEKTVMTDKSQPTPSWQNVAYKKRKIQESPETAMKTKTGTHTTNTTVLRTQNRFSVLTNQSEASQNDTVNATVASNTTNQPRVSKPPPVFIPHVSDFTKMIEEISTMVEKDAFTAKSLANGTVRIYPSTVEDYRKIVTGLRAKNTQYYTFQLKADRAFKVVIRNLHHSIDTKVIKDELQEKGFTVRNVANIQHWKTKVPLPLFFVDLEPTENCKSIYSLQSLVHTRITVESPLPKRDIVQCKRCQRYGHTRTYCTLQVVCVKCGENHDNRACTKLQDADPKCGLCQGKHPANYKGCAEYQKMIKRPSIKTRPAVNQESYRTVRPTLSFADITANKVANERTTPQPVDNQSNTNRLEKLMEQLISQNAQILGLLTTLIGKLSK